MEHSPRPCLGENTGTRSSDPSDQPLVHSDKLAITFTRFRGPEGSRLTKVFSLDKKSNICKESQPKFASGTAETIKIEKPSELENFIEGLGPNECISTGIFDIPSCKIVTKDRLTDSLADVDVRSRSKDQMRQPYRGLALLDHDPSPYMPKNLRCASPKDLMAKMQTAVPKLIFVAYLGAGSCSNGIYITATNEPYQGGGGVHVYIPVENVDLEALALFLKVNLWNAGFGFMAFARNGAMLPRCIVDLSVLSPERLIYEAIPILGDGLSHHPREWQHRGGPMLSGDFSLKQDEIDKFDHRVAEARTDPVNIAKSQELQNAYREVKVEELAHHKSISKKEARRQIPKLSAADLEKKEHTLSPNDMLEIKDEKLLASELWSRGREFDYTSMPDPIEGAAYGKGTAIFYFNNGNKPCIRSHAHGQITTYLLSGHDEFNLCKTIVIKPGKKSPDRHPIAANPLDRYSLRDRNDELRKLATGQVHVLGEIALKGESTVIYAPPNTGKTLLAFSLLIEAIKQGRVDPSKLYYINVDDSIHGLIEKNDVANQHGFHMLAEGHSDFQSGEFLHILDNKISNDHAKDTVIVLDTAKKFTDLMDKRKSSKFCTTIRRFTMKGGTCILLAHTNKNRGNNGKLVHAGTTDIREDSDCVYLLDKVSTDENSQTRIVQFENIKNRGDVARTATYSYSVAEKISYAERLDSVTPVVDTDLAPLKQAANLKADGKVINIVMACIREGITTKMKLADAAAKQSGISKRAAIKILEKYTGTDPTLHKWICTVQNRGAKVYSILGAEENE